MKTNGRGRGARGRAALSGGARAAPRGGRAREICETERKAKGADFFVTYLHSSTKTAAVFHAMWVSSFLVFILVSPHTRDPAPRATAASLFSIVVPRVARHDLEKVVLSHLADGEPVGPLGVVGEADHVH